MASGQAYQAEPDAYLVDASPFDLPHVKEVSLDFRQGGRSFKLDLSRENGAESLVFRLP